MPIGNPVTLTSNVASKTISATATASQTLFNVTGGYRINSLGVFKNGSRLQDGVDYIARDGLTVTLLSAASGGDKLQFVVFDTFRVAEAIRPAVDEQTIRGNLNVVGILSATNLEGPLSFNITSGIQTFHDVRVGGALTVAGSLTYEDTTNTNTTGIATFSGGMNISGVGATVTTLNVTGVSTFAGAINGNVTGNLTGTASNASGATGDFSIADKIIHTGDTNTAIRFPAADTFTVETGGSEAIRVDSGNRLLIGDTSSATVGSVQSVLQVSDASGPSRILTIRTEDGANGSGMYIAKSRNGGAVTNNDQIGGLFFVGHDGTDLAHQAAQLVCEVDGAVGSNDIPGRLVFKTTSDGASSSTERLRITSDGKVRVPDTGRFTCGTDDDLALRHSGTTGVLENNTGSFYIDQLLDDGDIYIRSDDGSGGSATYFQASGGDGQARLFHYGTKKFNTTSDGVTVTGTLNATTAVTINGTAAATTGKAIAMALIFG